MIKVVNPSVEVWKQEGYDLESIFKHIARCARVCYTPDTEVLTDNGWKRFDNLQNEDKVLSYNPETNTLLYDNPNIVINDYDDDLVCINNQYIQLSVTKEHRMYLDDTYKKYNYKFVKAIDMFNKAQRNEYKEFRLPKKFKNIIVERNISIPKLEHTKVVNGGNHKDIVKTITFEYGKSFIDLLGAFITEGCTYHGEKYGIGSYCLITQTENTELYKIIIDALNDLHIQYKIYSANRNDKIKQIRFGNSVYVDYFDKLVGKGSHNIHLPKWFRNIPEKDLRRLLYVLYLGDGSHNTTRREHYCSVSKRLLDEVQELFVLLGSAATVSYSNDARYCYTNELINFNAVCRKKDMYLQHYEGKVYCTSTKSGIICIRKNGIMCWCGNCYQSTPKNNGETDYGFLVRTLFRGNDVGNQPYNTKDIIKCHLSVCEHGTVHLKYPLFMPRAAAQATRFIHNQYSRTKEHEGYIYVTTNMRVLIEHHWMDELEFIDTTPNCPYYIPRTTVCFITDIGASRELNRHRVNSISEESTRYCAYDKGKFGNGITVAKLPWIPDVDDTDRGHDYREGFFNDNEVFDNNVIEEQYTDNWTAVDWFLYGLQICDLVYRKTRELGWTAQQAREILPLNTKTQVVHTAFVDDWEHWLALRSSEVSGKVHPMMGELAKQLVKQVYPE